MPQPDSSSISTFTHLRPLLAYRRCSTGLSAVTVVADPNITCPTSTLTSAWVFTYSITARAGERVQDLPWRDGGRPERIVQTAHVAPISSTLPHCDAARVHDLDRVTPSRPQEPRHVIARPGALTGGELAEQIVVVAEQHEEAGIDDRRVVELRVRVSSGERSHRRFHHRGIAEPGVAIAGRKGARHGPPGARARDRAILEPRRGEWIGGVLFGE